MKKPFYKRWVFIFIIVIIITASITGYYISKEEAKDEQPGSYFTP